MSGTTINTILDPVKLRVIHMPISLIDGNRVFENGRVVYGKDNLGNTISHKIGNGLTSYALLPELLLPTGGNVNQILSKIDSTNFKAVWKDNSFANLSGNPADNANMATILASKADTNSVNAAFYPLNSNPAGYLTSTSAATVYYPLSTNPSGYLTGITSGQVTAALGYIPENTANKGIANGYVPLNNSLKIDAAYLPSYVSDIITASTFSALPAFGTAGFLYITADTNFEYRWNAGTNAYIRLVASPGTTDALAEGVSNLYYTNARVKTYADTLYYPLSNPAAYINRASLSATGPVLYDPSTGIISSQAASASQNGYLSSTDWNTFNNKQPALTAINANFGLIGPVSGTAGIPTFRAFVANDIPTTLNATTIPTIYGGSGITSTLNLQGTTGNGTLTSAAINFLTGNNGGTNAITILNNGHVGIANTNPTYALDVIGVLRSTLGFFLNTDLGLFPVSSNQSVIQTFWGMQLAGLTNFIPEGYTPVSVGISKSAYHVVIPMSQTSAAGLAVLGVASQASNYFEITSAANKTTVHGDIFSINQFGRFLLGTTVDNGIDIAQFNGSIITTVLKSGSLQINGSASGSAIIKTPAAAGTPTFTLPATVGTAGQVMTTDGSVNGILSWTTPYVNPMTTLGDIIYGGVAGAATRLPGNTTTEKLFLTQTGTGTISAAPTYFDLFGTANAFSAAQTFSSDVTIGGYLSAGNSGRFGGGANYINYGVGVNVSSVPIVYWVFNYNGTAAFFSNAGNSLTDYQNQNDFLFGSVNNIGISAGGGSQVSVYAQFMAASKSFILNGGNGSGFADNPSAIFQMYSTTKGMLPPVMSTAQKNAIAAPAEGLVLYDNSLHSLQVYNGTAWTSSGSGGGSAGVGVPAGGTTGQILAKNSNTDYDDHWIDLPAGSTSFISRTFNPVLTFDINFKMVTTQTADIAFSMAAGPVADVEARVIIVGDGIHGCTFPAGSTNANAQQFDNTAKNIIDFVYDGYELLYAITKVATPDVTAPYLLSAVISNGAKNQIVLSYSELLDFTSVPANGDFSVNLGKSVANVVVSGSLVTITVDSPYAYGDTPILSYNPGGNPIQDPSYNHALALVNISVTNNVLPGITSMTLVGANQIPATSVAPTPLIFGSGGSGGTDTPISVSFWIKRANTANNAIFSIGSISDVGQQNLLVQFDTSNGELVYQIFSGGGQMYITANTLVPAGVWAHIVLTYDGNKLASGQKVYINGSSVPVTVQIASYPGQLAYVADTRLVVFATPVGSNTGSPQEPAYNYLISQLYFWNKELTSSDVSSIYNGGALVDPSLLPIHGNLIARYDFNGNLTEQINGLNLSSTLAPNFSTDHV